MKLNKDARSYCKFYFYSTSINFFKIKRIQVRGRRLTRIEVIKLSTSSLHSGSVVILDAGNYIFQVNKFLKNNKLHFLSGMVINQIELIKQKV